jgi:hypothetical protein
LGLQEGHIYVLKDYLFGTQWEKHVALLRRAVREVANLDYQRKLTEGWAALSNFAHSRAPGSSGYGPAAGRGRGTGPRLPLRRGGYTLKEYPGAAPEPQRCCRARWVDGMCNATGGLEKCPFIHEAEHKGRAFTN